MERPETEFGQRLPSTRFRALDRAASGFSLLGVILAVLGAFAALGTFAAPGEEVNGAYRVGLAIGVAIWTAVVVLALETASMLIRLAVDTANNIYIATEISLDGGNDDDTTADAGS